MSTPLLHAPASSSRRAWALPVSSPVLGGLLLLPAPRTSYLIGLTVTVLTAAALIAAEDYRTGLLRNQWTGPLAAGGVIQVLIASTGTPSWVTAVASALLGATITTCLYLGLGLLGWVGFGDVKFAAGLALYAAISTGWAGLLLLPLALTFSAISHLTRPSTRGRPRPPVAHGPALAAALAVLMATACCNAQ